nr:hypothetical protein BaRGS_026307 [Batillaria attramentaria]
MHMLLHAGENPFTCLKCSAGFAKDSDLKVHMKKHTKDKLYQCFVCPLMFKRKRNLTDHLLKHLKTRPSFKCEKCFVAFTQEAYLDEHMMKKHSWPHRSFSSMGIV